MGRRCTICDSTNRAGIEAAITERMKNSRIIELYGCTRRQIDGHRMHMAAANAKALELQGQGLLPLPANMSQAAVDAAAKAVYARDELLDIREKITKVFDHAGGEKNPSQVKLAALAERRAVVESMVKLGLMELERDEEAQGGDPTWPQVKEALRRAITRHPEARDALLEALAELSA